MVVPFTSCDKLNSSCVVNLEKTTLQSSLFGTSIPSKLSVSPTPPENSTFAASLSSLFGGKGDTVMRVRHFYVLINFI